MTQPRKQHFVRIIGGTWRSRRLRFPDLADLRPTPDRVRETLFNWLRNDIEGARCLDLFAGSGALGFEALSRGAQQVVFVENERSAADALRLHAVELATNDAAIQATSAEQFLRGSATPFDIVFLDPPFRLQTWDNIAAQLEQHNWLKPRALIYVESPSEDASLHLPATWHLLRDKTAGEVRYGLYERRA